jgi:hypothetical protein
MAPRRERPAATTMLRTVLSAALLAAAIVPLVSCGLSSTPDQSRPNIVIILSHD